MVRVPRHGWMGASVASLAVVACGASNDGAETAGRSSSSTGGSSALSSSTAASTHSGSDVGGGTTSGSAPGSTSTSAGHTSSDGSATPGTEGGIPEGGRDASSDATAAKVTLWIAGDSTVADVSPATPTFFGWGQQIGALFDSKVTVKNLAIGGRSVAFFMYQVAHDAGGNTLCTDTTGDPQYVLDAGGNRVDTSQWAAIKSGMVPGDYFMVQFGTNDITTVCPRHVSIADYETDLGVMAAAVRAKGGNPIFITPVSQNSCPSGTNVATLTTYAAAAKAAGATAGAPVIDLNTLSVQYYQSLGCTATTADVFAAGQSTHFTEPGAVSIAGLVTKDLTQIGSALAAHVLP
jgi:lysophospholipase L1-like esterase